ncbi:MAG: hypothetical protein FJ128_06885 [Deltaproteobacteria bacterium]|nr:hypothetical protein [Deltaproteobacteria bacterium]
MLVFVSDLHFTDGTAGEHNIPSRAFSYFFEHLRAIAAKEHNLVEELTIVLLGDTFDFLRTEYWFDVPEDESPWGTNFSAMEVHAARILQRIALANRPSLDLIRRELENFPAKFRTLLRSRNRRQPRLVPKLLYFPGNHDRLLQLSPLLRRQLCELLPLKHDHHKPFPAGQFWPAYQVAARHGHEYDPYNFEGTPTFTEADYHRAPIGDPLTTELIVRLPFEVRRRLQALPPDYPLSDQEKKGIVASFQEIDNVRPLAHVIPWLRLKIDQEAASPRLRTLFEAAVDAAIRKFQSLKFVKRWYHDHCRGFFPGYPADRVGAVMFLADKLPVFSAGKLLELAVHLYDRLQPDHLLAAAPRDLAGWGDQCRYLVYGHTHLPLVVPLSRTAGVERYYLNTGTWRTRHLKTRQGDAFASFKTMTYVIFYQEGERSRGQAASFETWHAALKTL